MILIQTFLTANCCFINDNFTVKSAVTLSPRININIEQFKQVYLNIYDIERNKIKKEELNSPSDAPKTLKQDAFRTAWMLPLGDIIAQLIANGHIEPFRLAYMSIIGLGTGSVLHYYLSKLDGRFPGKEFWFTKIVVDQFIFTPVFHILNFSIIAFLEGHLGSLKNLLETSYLSTHFINWAFWIPANIVNFRHISPGRRVLYMNVVSLLWMPLLSLLGHGEINLGPANHLPLGLIMGIGVTALALLLKILWKPAEKSENITLSIEEKENIDFLVDKLIQEVQEAKAPEDLVEDYIPGYTPTTEVSYPENLKGRIESARNHLRLATSDSGLLAQTDYALTVLAAHPSTPVLNHIQFEKIAHKLVKLITGVDDAYKSYKNSLDETVFKIYPVLRQKINEMDGSEKGVTDERIRALKTALIYSATLNYLDITHPEVLKKAAQNLGIEMGLSTAGQIESEAILNFVEGVFRKINELGLIIDDFEFLADKLKTNKGGKVLYLVDNHGEVILDMLVIEQLLEMGFKVTVGGKGEFIRDDATYEELKKVLENNRYLLPYIRKGQLKIISTGSDALGTDLTTADRSVDFKYEFKNSFMYIAKGAGNFVLMYGQKYKINIHGFHVLGFKSSDTAYSLLNKKRKGLPLTKREYDLAIMASPKREIAVPVTGAIERVFTPDSNLSAVQLIAQAI